MAIGCRPAWCDSLSRVQAIRDTPGLVAFWDFRHHSDGVWTSYAVQDSVNPSFPVYLRRVNDRKSYTPGTWPYRDEESQLRFDDSGPFGRAVRFNRGYIYGEVPRDKFDGTELDLHGKNPFTLIAWVKFVDQRHFVVGIWDEGGWNKYAGQRQAALFSGLFGRRCTIAHVSATGAACYPQSSLFEARYARMAAVDGQSFHNGDWVAMAMTFDPVREVVSAYLNGRLTQTFLSDPVVNDVFTYDAPQLANPFAFPWRIYSPRDFIIKLEGQNRSNSNLHEHWLRMDLNHNRIMYGQNEIMTKATPRYRLQLRVTRAASPLFQAVFDTEAICQSGPVIPKNVHIMPGDVIHVTVEEWNDGQWRRTGADMERAVGAGAPFTFGRALGIETDSIEAGSHIYIDGVAVFNRTLSDKELQNLAFVKTSVPTSE